MATGFYPVIDGTTRKAKANYAVVGSTTRKINKMYAVVDGVTRLIWGGEMEINPVFNGLIALCGSTRKIYTISSNALEYLGSYSYVTPDDMLSKSGEYWIDPSKTSAKLYKWSETEENYVRLVTGYSMADDIAAHTLAANGSYGVAGGGIAADGSKALILANRSDDDYGATYGLIYDLTNDTFVVSQALGALNTHGAGSDHYWHVNTPSVSDDLSVIACDFQTSWTYNSTDYSEKGYSIWVKSGSGYTKIKFIEVDSDEIYLDTQVLKVSPSGQYITVPSSSTEELVVVYYRSGTTLTQIGTFSDADKIWINEESGIMTVMGGYSNYTYTLSFYKLSNSSITLLGTYKLQAGQSSGGVTSMNAMADETVDGTHIAIANTYSGYNSSAGTMISGCSLSDYRTTRNTNGVITALTDMTSIASNSSNQSYSAKYIGV